MSRTQAAAESLSLDSSSSISDGKTQTTAAWNQLGRGRGVAVSLEREMSFKVPSSTLLSSVLLALWFVLFINRSFIPE